jgi:hypothetical protein
MTACRPVVIHSVLMSIIFEHYKQLTRLQEGQVKDVHTVQEVMSNRSSTLDSWMCKECYTDIEKGLRTED